MDHCLDAEKSREKKEKKNESWSTKLKKSSFAIDRKLVFIELNTRIKNIFKSRFLFLPFLGNQTE